MANASRRFARTSLCFALLILAASAPRAAWSAAPKPGPPLTIQKLSGPITLDGNLDDAGWKGIAPITQWFETNVGDNVEPQVGNKAWLAYDEHYLYAAFQFDDPHPELIRAPLGDHDAISSTTDYGGLIVDSRNDSKTARMFLCNPNGVQYDAVSSDVSGEDNSPDFFWDAVGKITPTGWNLEIRVPFSSLRYSNEANPTWGMLLYRNYPRDRHYQFFSARLPRDVNCFICNSSKMTGLASLPHGSHLVVAPYGTAERSDELAPNAPLGDPLVNGDIKRRAGVDVKWSPLADVAIDGTFRPDFSQVESDVAQIGTNERFALFYPEKRSFFLEGVDLFSTPLQAVYTRTVNSPSAGLRATGRMGTTSFTALGTHDDGGGIVILPGPEGSGAALQDFESNVGIVRVRRDLGQSFVSVLATDREIAGGGHNIVAGPDFQWRPRPTETITGQAVFSDSRTPNRPDLASEWDGRTLTDHAFLLNAQHATAHNDVFAQEQILGPDFRADEGFIPQVGYREIYFESGHTFRPKQSFYSRIRVFTVDWLDNETAGAELSKRFSVGAGADGKWNSFTRVELNRDAIRTGGKLLWRTRPRLNFQVVPGRVVNFLSVDAYFGHEIDFTNSRLGRGATITTQVVLRPNTHLEMRNDASARWLNIGPGSSDRVFLAEAERLRSTWSFNSRSFLRLIGQYLVTRREPSLYGVPVDAKSADLTGSALFAYKLNWQTVLFVGYGDEHTFTDMTGNLEPTGRQVFAKISYAIQQ